MIEITIDKRKIKRFLLVITLIVAGILVFKLGSMLFMSYKGIIKNTIDNINNQEISKLTYDKYAMTDSQYDLAKEQEDDDKYMDYIEEFKVLYGSKYKITYDISEETKLSEEEMSSIRQDISIADEELQISNGYRIKLECKIDGSLNSKEFILENIIVVKINGKWLFVSYYGEGKGVNYYLFNPINPEHIYSKVKSWY